MISTSFQPPLQATCTMDICCLYNLCSCMYSPGLRPGSTNPIHPWYPWYNYYMYCYGSTTTCTAMVTCVQMWANCAAIQLNNLFLLRANCMTCIHTDTLHLFNSRILSTNNYAFLCVCNSILVRVPGVSNPHIGTKIVCRMHAVKAQQLNMTLLTFRVKLYDV